MLCLTVHRYTRHGKKMCAPFSPLYPGGGQNKRIIIYCKKRHNLQFRVVQHRIRKSNDIDSQRFYEHGRDRTTTTTVTINVPLVFKTCVLQRVSRVQQSRALPCWVLQGATQLQQQYLLRTIVHRWVSSAVVRMDRSVRGHIVLLVSMSL